MPTIVELGAKVKAKYPGEYDHLSDADVGAKVKAKYPGSYDQFVDLPQLPAPHDQAAANIAALDPQAPALRTIGKALNYKTGDPFLDAHLGVLQGAGKGVMSTGLGGVNLVNRLTGNQQVDTPETRGVTEAHGVPENIGKFGEQTAEFLLPAATATKALKAAPLVAKVGTQALLGGGVSALQSGGDPAATATGTVLSGAGELAGPALRAVRGKFAGVPLTAAERRAVDLGRVEGVPMTPATLSGQGWVQPAQHQLGRMLGSSGVVRKGVLEEQTALGQLGKKIADEVHPQSVTARAAGEGLGDELTSLEAQHRADAAAGYKNFQDIEKQHVVPVQTGAKTTQSTLMGPNGQPIPPVHTPVIENIPMPVDLRQAKTWGQGARDEISKGMVVGQRQYSPALLALDNLIAEPDFVSASVADRNLSAIKAMARGEGRGSHLAGQIISQLEPEVTKAASIAGPDAIKELHGAREAWKAKIDVADTIKSLSKEPVTLFNRLTTKDDTAIHALESIAAKAPDTMPKMGRAYMEGLLDTAFDERGMARPQTALRQWDNLGDDTKKLLYPDPRMRNRIDDFMGLMKKAGENPNPSGTAASAASVVHLLTSGAMLTHPAGAVTAALTPYTLSKLMMSERGAQLLSQGLKISPSKNPAAAHVLRIQIARELAKQGLGPGQAGVETAVSQQ